MTPAYTGTVGFTSSDGQAVLPGTHTFTAAEAGTASFTATLKTAHVQTLTITDSANSLSDHASILVSPAAASFLVVAGSPLLSSQSSSRYPPYPGSGAPPVTKKAAKRASGRSVQVRL